MKVRRRSVPLDSLSVDDANRSIVISTHRKIIRCIAVDSTHLTHHELTFTELFALIEKLRDRELPTTAEAVERLTT